MIRLVRVELLKIRSTRMWLGLLLGAVGFAALGAIATLVIAGTPQGVKQGLTAIRTSNDVRDLVYGTALQAGLFALILGATSMTTEYRSGTVAGTFLATPKRRPVVIAKTMANGLVGFVFGLAVALIPVMSAFVYFKVKGWPVAMGRPVLDSVVIVCVISAYCGAVGAGVGAAIRNQLVAIIGVICWHVLVEQLLGGLVHVTMKWLPFLGTQGALSQRKDGFLSPAEGILLMVLYLGVALAIGIVVTSRRDVV